MYQVEYCKGLKTIKSAKVDESIVNKLFKFVSFADSERTMVYNEKFDISVAIYPTKKYIIISA